MKLSVALAGALALACGSAHAQSIANVPYAGSPGTGAPSTADQIVVHQGVAPGNSGGNAARMTLQTLQGLIGGLPLSGGTLTGPLQFGSSRSAALSNDGASNDIIVNPSASVSDADTDFILYPPSAAGAWFIVNSVGGANQQQLILGSIGNAATNYELGQAIAGTGNYLPIRFNGGSTDAFTLTTDGRLQLDNHLSAASSALSSVGLTSCGTSPSGSSTNDVRGTIAIGSGTVTSCVVTFHTAYATTPIVVLTGLGTGSTVLSLSALSTTGFTISASASIGGQYVTYVVMQ